VLIAVRWIALPIEGFIGVNIGLVLIWFGVAVVVIREHAKLSVALEEDPSDK
jgi:hypothetical protein